MARGKLILLSGPTGSGKGTLMRHATEHFPELGTLDSYTTRARRPDHVENGHYQFVSRDEFETKVKQGEMLEWAEFSGNYYGTLKADVDTAIKEGTVLIKEMDIQGVRQVMQILPKDDYVTVFIDGGPWEGLKARAQKRAPITEEELVSRKARYDEEMQFMPEADIIVHNGEGQREQADREFENVVAEALHGNK